jgi:hypothetical protein
MWFSEISVLCGLAQDIPLVVQLCRLGSCCAASEHILLVRSSQVWLESDSCATLYES